MFQEHGLTLLEPQSRFGDQPLKLQVVCPQNGTAVLKGLIFAASEKERETAVVRSVQPGEKTEST